ncbi:MAG: ABC transporter substrate-binding protein [Thermomicrobiales bacterium]|nr:ABC transporter substrate-binding protein [Thermomicrobiales bacterium]
MSESASSLMREFMVGRITRRELLARAGAAGMSVSALAAAVSTPWLSSGVSAQASGELVVAIAQDIDTLDPHISQLLMFGDTLRRTVFNGLVTYADDLSYLGDLAESWENPDDTTYVFKLRDGLTYHDGTAVDASHVEFSYKRIAEQATVWSSRVANIASYEVNDPTTITITLNNVQADFLDGLVPLSIISPEIAENIENAAVGTGPFKFVEWVTNDHISLEANPDFYDSSLPGVATVRFNVIAEPQVAITNLQSGDVNGVNDVPVSQVAPLEGDDRVNVINVPTSSIHIFEMIGKNHETIRTNAAVRQALAYCLDKNAVQQTVFSGGGLPKWSFVGSTHWAYKDVPGYDYDPAAAAAILEEQGVSDLEFTVLCIQGYPDGERAATIWQAGLAEAGITMNIEIQELSVWLDNYINHTYDVIWNVFPGFADPNYFVSLGLEPHFADGWTNEEAQELGTSANQTLDQAARTEQYGRLQELFVQDLPILVIQEAPKVSLTAPNVSGWEINPLSWIGINKVTIAE